MSDPYRSLTAFEYMKAEIHRWAACRVVIPIEDLLELVSSAEALNRVKAPEEDNK